MRESKIKSFDYASETTKLIISLSTGIVTIILTFNEKILSGIKVKWLLTTSMVLLLISILSGIMVMMALTGTLAIKKTKKNISINSNNIRIPSIIQLSSFVLSMIFFVIHIFTLI